MLFLQALFAQIFVLYKAPFVDELHIICIWNVLLRRACIVGLGQVAFFLAAVLGVTVLPRFCAHCFARAPGALLGLDELDVCKLRRISLLHKDLFRL